MRPWQILLPAALLVGAATSAVEPRSLADLLVELNRLSPVPLHAIVGEHDTALTIQTGDRKLEQILDDVVAQTHGGVARRADCIDLLNAEVTKDPRHPLRMPIASFVFEGGDAMQAAFALFSKPELVEARFFITQSWMLTHREELPNVKLSLEKTTVLEALDAIAAAGKSYWVIQDQGDKHVLAFHPRP
ncbi:MAG TPA: hypothetical protein VJS92_18380 [Candidatus Polarisedimenticolaceae bacterium]|nr:hypothetical protein [Candidatus Polarisedimenticolaceae bacterium]